MKAKWFGEECKCLESKRTLALERFQREKRKNLEQKQRPCPSFRLESHGNNQNRLRVDEHDTKDNWQPYTRKRSSNR